MATKTKSGKGKGTPANLLGSNPESRKTRFKDDEKESLAYKVLNADQTKQLLDLEDVDSVQGKLQEILKLEDPNTDLKEGTMLDYFVSGVWWTKEQSFTADQASAMYTVLHNMLENVKERQFPLPESLKEFKKLFAGIGMDNTDISGGLGCFDTNQAKLIMKYFHDSLFQHYKMYEFVFGTMQAEEIIGTDLTIEVPQAADLPWPPPLEEGVPEEIYNMYIATPPPTPAPKAAEEGAEGEEGKQPAEGGKTEEELAAEGHHVADLLAQVSPEEIKDIMNTVFEDMLGGLKVDVQSKLRQKENDYINRINKVHRTPSAKSSKS